MLYIYIHIWECESTLGVQDRNNSMTPNKDAHLTPLYTPTLSMIECMSRVMNLTMHVDTWYELNDEIECNIVRWNNAMTINETGCSDRTYLTKSCLCMCLGSSQNIFQDKKKRIKRRLIMKSRKTTFHLEAEVKPSHLAANETWLVGKLRSLMILDTLTERPTILDL